MSHNEIIKTKAITLTIDGKLCKGTSGQTILEIARENDIYVPTMCYLSKTNPIASCRMCVVEVKDLDGMILGCQQKAIDGIEVTVNSDTLYKERQNIMKLYNVNHPLECGVCDKSGECDLQNKTLEFDLVEQTFSAKDQPRKNKKWGILGYDPSLCIMCEKCVHTCNEVIGAAALYIKPGGYKSTIDIKYSRCEQCGDCISVCPVGALISNDYKYTANAWESKKIPATCAHCSAGCQIYYEVKSDSVENFDKKKIARVTNEFEFDAICSAGRFAFNFETKVKNGSLNEAVEAFKSCDTIKFNSYITNEEAMILQNLKTKLGVNLVNEDARNFQEFTKGYNAISDFALYQGNNETIKKSDGIILLGSRITKDNPIVQYNINMAYKRNGANFVYMHPIDDSSLQDKYKKYVQYEAGSEEAVLAMLCKYLVAKMPEDAKAYFDDLDIGNLCGESNVGEVEFDAIIKLMKNKKSKTLIIGEDVFGHKRVENIGKLIAFIEKFSDFDVVVVPASTNTIGVSLICSLDEKTTGKTVGYNVAGDYKIGTDENADFSIAALNQQEGTFVSMDKKVLNTNVALEFDGFCLNDIANSILDLKVVNTIDYTSILPAKSGFVAMNFDDMISGASNMGEDLRGYPLDKVANTSKPFSIEPISPLDIFNGSVVYRCEPLGQFNNNTSGSNLIPASVHLRGSSTFAKSAQIKPGQKVILDYGNSEIEVTFKTDSSLKGTIALCPTFDTLEDNFMKNGYRFKQVKIKKAIENE